VAATILAVAAADYKHVAPEAAYHLFAKAKVSFNSKTKLAGVVPFSVNLVHVEENPLAAPPTYFDKYSMASPIPGLGRCIRAKTISFFDGTLRRAGANSWAPPQAQRKRCKEIADFHADIPRARWKAPPSSANPAGDGQNVQNSYRGAAPAGFAPKLEFGDSRDHETKSRQASILGDIRQRPYSEWP